MLVNWVKLQGLYKYVYTGCYAGRFLCTPGRKLLKILRATGAHNFDVLMGSGLKYFNDREDRIDLIEVFRKRVIPSVKTGKKPYRLNLKINCCFANLNTLPRLLKRHLPAWNTRTILGIFLMIEQARIDGKGHSNDVEGLVLKWKL